MDFGKKLGILREKKGWSQYEVATKLGIKRPRYNAWEQGIANPRADMLGKISELFDIEINDLLNEPKVYFTNFADELAEKNNESHIVDKELDLSKNYLQRIKSYLKIYWIN